MLPLLFLAESGLAVDISFQHIEIDTQIRIGYGLAIEDMDADGDKDIILADAHQMVWYENPGWEKHVLTEKLSERDHVCLAARDIDGDGKAEIAIGAEWNPGDTISSGSVQYLLPPSEGKAWESVRLQHDPTTHRMAWAKTGDGSFDLIVLPLHGAGNKSGQGDGVRMLAYHMPKDPKNAWTTTQISGDYHMTHNLDPVQWDSDSAEEILLCSREGIFLFDFHLGTWHEQQIAGQAVGHENFIGAGEVRMGQLKDKTTMVVSIEPMHGNQVVVYTTENRNDPTATWQRNEIETGIRQGHAIACGDLMKLGWDQAVVGWRNPDEQGRVGIRLYVSLDGKGETWESVWVDDNTMACEDLRLEDLNGDGLLDIVASGRSTKNVKVYLNQGMGN